MWHYSDSLSQTVSVSLQCLLWLVEASQNRNTSKSSDFDSNHTVPNSRVWIINPELMNGLSLTTSIRSCNNWTPGLPWSCLYCSIRFEFIVCQFYQLLFSTSLWGTNLFWPISMSRSFKIRYSGIFAILNLFRFWN